MPLWNGAPLLNLVYPVGSIYWSSNNTNPGTLFGGTWTQIKDKFILAAGDSYTNGATGGAATVTLTVSNMPSHSHSFTPSGTVSSSFTGTAGTTGYMNSNASHRHVITEDSNSTLERYDSNESAEDVSASGKGDGYHFWTSATNTDHTHSFTPSGTVSSSFSGTAGTTGSNGSGSSFSILPPYIVKYCWERIA